MSCHCVRPIVCPPQYVVRDFFVPQAVPVIHPVVTVNRQNIVNVPQHYVQQFSTTEVVTAPQIGFTGAAGLFNGRLF
ncbi:MAG: hypothetical protein GX248_10925 [Peptococcaceae bacterium]|jgi:hypothetical protein|nr:hypothetical protein [Peptococcaceae bacterium]